jgi:two-component system chemotaxis response regulator CheY
MNHLKEQGASMRVLVIDDARAMRSILRHILGQIGFQVEDAANGREGLERLQGSEKPDLILVDWNMPEMNGYDFVRAVRANRAYDDVRLMMVSTENEIESLAMALEAGANEYVMKPFNKEMILEKLEILGLPVPQT